MENEIRYRTDGFTGEEFVGYTFNGSPERRPRLWFLDRHIAILLSAGPIMGGILNDIDIGQWSAIADGPQRGLTLPRLALRYEHCGPEKWVAVWRITDVTIPHVYTFGRDDDVWRLGVWPD